MFTRYGLMVTESTVSFVSWKRGTFTLIKDFVNDTQGISDFASYMKKNAAKYTDKSISICVSVIGEDYRFEKVAHLYGKYRTDMLNRRFQQLFRGTTYHTALYQGREAIGRRQDFFLFCGILSNEKIQPWVREVTRFHMHIAGIHLGSILINSIASKILPDKSGVNVVSLIMNQGFIRHNFYIDGNLRFSRLSRSNENASADEIYRLVRGEIEKTSQYLVSIKLIPNNAKIRANVVCADDVLDQLRDVSEQTKGERVSLNPISARVVAGVIGIKRPISEFGRDSSFIMHEMFRSVRFVQLASLAQVRFYLIESIGGFVAAATLLWGAFNVLNHGVNSFLAFNQYSGENATLRSDIQQRTLEYNSLVNEFVQPPSSSENMRASVNVLNHVIDVEISPGKLMLFLSKELTTATSLNIDSVTWFVTNNIDDEGDDFAYANGRKFYEIIDVTGFIAEDADPESSFEQYKRFVKDIDRRPDMTLVERASPSLVEAGGVLSGTLEEGTDVRETLNAFTNNGFIFRIAWDPEYDFEAEDGQGDA